jgi:hypothetical protein
MRLIRLLLLSFGVVLLGFLGIVLFSRPAVKITSFALAEKVPLAAEAEIRTRRPSRVSLTVKGRNGAEDLQVSFSRESRTHRVPVLGLYADYDNSIEFTVTDNTGLIHRLTRSVATDPLPKDYPDILVRTPLPEKSAGCMPETTAICCAA